MMGSMLEGMLSLSSAFVLLYPLLYLRVRKPEQLYFPDSLATWLPVKFSQWEPLTGS